MSKPQRQAVMVAVIVVGFGATAYSLFGRKSGPTIASKFTEAGVCLSCQAEGVVTYPRGEPAPHRCPKCGTPAFYPWYYCYDCNKRFVPALVQREPGGPLRLPLGVACTSCGSGSVTPLLPNQPEYEDAETAPLPKWP